MPIKAYDGWKSDKVNYKTKTIITITDNCTGCQLCQIACSWVKHQEFNPAWSYIDIQHDKNREGRFDARFTDQCDACGYCSFYCQYDAIQFFPKGQTVPL